MQTKLDEYNQHLRNKVDDLCEEADYLGIDFFLAFALSNKDVLLSTSVVDRNSTLGLIESAASSLVSEVGNV